MGDGVVACRTARGAVIRLGCGWRLGRVSTVSGTDPPGTTLWLGWRLGRVSTVSGTDPPGTDLWLSVCEWVGAVVLVGLVVVMAGADRAGPWHRPCGACLSGGWFGLWLLVGSGGVFCGSRPDQAALRQTPD